jgi:hypothetical protein
MRRAITTTGLTPGMAPFTLGLILGGIWRQPRQSKVMIEWTADMPRKARHRLSGAYGARGVSDPRRAE